ncbi:hypothetical protein NCCP691_11180 [Noviherbaspirillum aridicola]|uniref:Uncharacterized protein n=2 Tax=Noviherbaspirillum aridicola TaxID=2849687 RepID=A0ABQ4Q1V2_9BURK|nr:hypothetical protein NCCP691_11180 [Noviherbaspirillum aridicola]
MNGSGSFTIANDETLCAAIRATRQTLVYVAPGITEPVVDAISECLKTRPHLLVTAIIDLDPEVYRLGYGTEEGLKALQKLAGLQQFALRQQEGLRVGLLVTDERTLVYAPTPLLIEAGSKTEHKPNAVVISRTADPTAALLHACGAPHAGNPLTPSPQESEVGRRPATPQTVQESLASLQDSPPKKFSVARAERVFESKVQFVELELTGYRLSAKRVSIPNDLLIGEEKALKERLKNSFLLLQGEQAIKVLIPRFDPKTALPVSGGDSAPPMEEWTETRLDEQRKALYDDFLINVPKFGQIIMRRNRPEFDQRVRLLEAQIAALNTAIQAQLQVKLLGAVQALALTLLPRVRDRLPQRYKRFLPGGMPGDDVLLGMLEQDLASSFGGSADVFKAELRHVYKDVTYESIRDQGFRDALSKALRDRGGERLAAQLFSEHDAAPEVGPGARRAIL